MRTRRVFAQTVTYVSSDLNDLEPLTPSHLLYGRRITTLPHKIMDDEVDDPTYGAPIVREMAKDRANCCIISRRDGEENILLHFVKIIGQQERMDKRSRRGCSDCPR